MVRLFGRLLSRRRSSASAVMALASYAEAEQSGWVSAPPQLAELPAAASGFQDFDPDALLARFYRSQEC